MYLVADNRDPCFNVQTALVFDFSFVIQILLTDGGDLLLASCSQDAYIRLWRIAMETVETTPTLDELRLTSNMFSISQGLKFTVIMESVLIGELLHFLCIIIQLYIIIYRT